MPQIKGYKEIPEVTPNQEQYRNIALLITNMNKLPYRKLENGNYRVYCTMCMNPHEYNKHEFKQIRHDGRCPKCNSHFKSTTKAVDKYYFKDHIRIGNYGYRVTSTLDINDDEPKLTSFEQIAYFGDPSCMWIRNSDVYYLNYYCNGIKENPIRNDYYKSFSRYAANRFINYYCYFSYIKGLLKGSELRTYLETEYPTITKSNQKKLIYDNRFTDKEIMAIKLFDLKTKEDVIKYSEYINKQTDLWLHEKKQFNIYHLDYLSRNDIDLGMYSRYLDRAKALGFKPDKPKDFNARLRVIEDIENKEKIRKDVERNKQHESNIAIRFNELPKYEKDNIKILPFSNVEEIIKCGTTLHNCIGNYVQRYSEKKTDIYHLDIDGAIKIALEIRNNTLQQAHADHNSSCPKDLFKYIKSFCNTNHISLGSYAQ